MYIQRENRLKQQQKLTRRRWFSSCTDAFCLPMTLGNTIDQRKGESVVLIIKDKMSAVVQRIVKDASKEMNRVPSKPSKGYRQWVKAIVGR